MTGEPVAARTALIEALRLVDAAWPDDRSPFPGLRPFEIDQHRVFFGRAEGAALLVVGLSGCGKSSLVRAGLRGWPTSCYWPPRTLGSVRCV